MSTKSIGWKIREARLARKMTQSEVVGTFITRNMLSQIESGVAVPSLKTLAYLSSVLQIPMEQLVQDPDVPMTGGIVDDEHPCGDTARRLLDAKEALRREAYSDAVTILTPLCTDDCPFSDEAYRLCTLALLRTATASLRVGGQDARHIAAEAASRALACADKGLYACGDLQAEARLVLRMIG